MGRASELIESQFCKSVLKDAFDVHKDLGIDFRDFDGDSGREPDELQFYILRVGFSTSHFLSWMRQLDEAVTLLSDYSYSKELVKAKITRLDHLIYNVENYYIRFNSIYDRSLQLVNAVFHLCMDEVNVSHAVVVSNIKVKRTGVPKLLKKVRKVTEENSHHRHAIVHRHSYMEPRLKKLELLYMHDRESWGEDNKTPYERLERARALRIKKLIAEYRAEFEGLNARAQEAVYELFSGLEREYKTQLVRLSKV